MRRRNIVLFCQNLILISIYCTCHSSSVLENEKVIKIWNSTANFSSYREARRSVVSGGLFSIVSFDNVPCLSLQKESGTCYSARECKNLKGTRSGVCAGNFGVCCVVQATCGATVTQNNTYFTNPDYPGFTSGPTSCCTTVNKLTGVNQLYLEFVDFSIYNANSTGQCGIDSFTISVPLTGSTQTYPVICGDNTGQSEYINFRSSAGPVTICFTLGAQAFDRKWKIRISQLKSTDLCAAPEACQQYSTETSGKISSFNSNGGRYILNSRCYRSCVRLKAGFCSILLTADPFAIGVPGTDINGACTSGNYVLVSGTKYCESTFPPDIRASGSPLTTVGVDICASGPATVPNPSALTGFTMNYVQQRCA